MDSIIKTDLFINGRYVKAKDGSTFVLLNPATGENIGDVSNAGQEDVDAAVEAAEKAQPAWEKLPAAARAAIIGNFADLIREHAVELTKLDAMAMGRPVASNQDAFYAGAAFDYFASLAHHVSGHSSLNTPGFLNITVRQPYGVCAGIIPWNVPLIMFAFKSGPAMAAGNAIIIKSSEKSPLSGAYLARLGKEAGIPDGILQVLSGKGDTGRLLSEHMRIRKISFTGSGRTARLILEAAAKSNMKNVTTELGGKSPCIVFDDADIDDAVAASSFSISWNSGQICVANSRIYVHANIYDEFCRKFADTFGEVKQGDPLDQGTTMGPQADAMQTKAVSSWLEVGNKDGKALIGGQKPEADSNFFAPTIFVNVPENSKINKEEVFGPVVLIHKFTDEADVINKANDTEYGLYAAVFSQNIDRALRVGKQLNSGHVGVNCTSPSWVTSGPLTTCRLEGSGRECGPDALKPWLEEKSMIIKVKGF